MKYFSVFLLVFLVSCKARPREVGGPCEGCEALNEYRLKPLKADDTLVTFKRSDSPVLKISGTIFDIDEKTPAKDIIVYIYHTNREGKYETFPSLTGWGRRHGIVRGWAKTNENGEYSFLTAMPAPYPDKSEPGRVHMIIQEPNTIPYYIDDIRFADDSLLTNKIKEELLQRGGNGIVEPTENQGVIYVTRDIILGKNIPDYHLPIL